MQRQLSRCKLYLESKHDQVGFQKKKQSTFDQVAA